MGRQLPPWVFAEFSPVGVDLDSVESVEAYDRNQGTDLAKDDALLDRLPVGPGTVFVDLGTGTGSLPMRAAERGATAYAVDVSANMLAFAAERAAAAGVDVLQQHAGFLSHDFASASVDVVTTRSALHQLPDTWKQAALNRIAEMLRPGGVFYLWDAMWSFDAAELNERLPEWIETMGQPDGQGFTNEMFATHLREEFSTFTWILEGMIERAGLRVVEANFPAPWYGEFMAVRSTA